MLIPNLKPDLSRIDPALDRLSRVIPAELTVSSIELPPCNRACPAGINVKGYIDLILQGRYKESLALVRRDNPMAGASGCLCLRPCEFECALRPGAGAIPIRDLKRFVAEFEVRSGALAATPGAALAGSGPRVAVVGAGPAGLSAARDLRTLGARPVLFEAEGEPGGLARSCQPDFRMPAKILRADVEYVLSCGVEIRTHAALGRDFTIDDLFRQEFKAVLVATGAPARMGGDEKPEAAPKLPKERGNIAIDARAMCDLLGREPDAVAKARKAAVIGGGPAALTTARWLKRCGVGEVVLAYRLRRADMPADPEEVEAALAEGIQLVECVAARAIEQRSGRPVGVTCERLEAGARSETGRASIRATGKKLKLRADLIVSADGRTFSAGPAASSTGPVSSPLGITASTPATLETSLPGVFVAGDAATGPRSLIEAVASGRRAAAGIARFLGLAEPLRGAFPDADPLRYDVNAEKASGDAPTSAGAPDQPRRLRPAATAAFQNLDDRTASIEAARCARCGHCSSCTVCSVRCEHRYVALPDHGRDRLVRVSVRREERLKAAGAISLQCRVDDARCIGCGRCEEACPHHAASVKLAKGRGFGAVIDPAACRFCWCCAAACPTGAIARPWAERPWGGKPEVRHAR